MTNRELAREHLARAVISLDNCTDAEHVQTVALQGIGFALLEIADAIRRQTDALVNDGVVTK